MTFDRYIESILLRRRGNNRQLIDDINKNLSSESKERLFRILQELEDENGRLMSKTRKYGFLP